MRTLSGLLAICANLAAVYALGACCDIDPSTVALGTRISWCQAQRNVCSELCGDTSENSCQYTTLDFSCVCGSGISPNVSDYAQSIPSFECDNWVEQCVTANANDTSALSGCTAVKCGSKDASASSSTSISASDSTSQRSSTSSIRSSSSSTETLGAGALVSSILKSVSDAVASATDSAGRRLSTSTPTQRTSATGSQQTGQSNQPPNDSTASDAGLSTGAKAGIAVGVVIGAIAALVTLFLLLRRRNGKGAGGARSFFYHRSTVNGGLPELETKEKAGELWGSKFHHTTDRELAGNEIHQAPGGYPVGHPNARDIPAGAALANGAFEPDAASQRDANTTSVELPTERAAADSDDGNSDTHAQKPPQSTPASPFAGAGPVPTHLPEYEHLTDDEPASAPLAPMNTVVEPPPEQAADSAVGAPAMPAASNEQDELAILKAELEQVKRERDRLQMMHSLSSREEELRRAIEVREMK